MRVLIALAILAAACSAGAQTYRWTDKEGKVRYGDTPPPGVKAAAIKAPAGTEAPAAAAGAASKAPPLPPEQAIGKRREEAEEARSNCQSSQRSLSQLESGQRGATTNASGERVFIDIAQRAKDLKRARKLVATWCK